MKRKIIPLTAIILSFSLLLTACGQKDIGEAKAKEIGLAYINQYFNANETEATVYRELLECYPEDTAAFSTNGDSEFYYRWIYRIQVPLAASLMKYEVNIIGSTGDLMYANQHQMNIILTDEQKEKANNLYAEGANWGKLHQQASEELYQACFDWSVANLDETRPILLDSNVGKEARGALLRTTGATYYVVTKDGRVYSLSMEWPSLQVVSISVINDPK